MPYCSVITCKNHSGKTNLANSGISYHKFPTEPEVTEKWIKATGRSRAWFPQKSSTICSKHFEDDVIYVFGRCRRVPEDAIPTLNLPDSESEDQLTLGVEDEEISDKPPNIQLMKMQCALERANKLIKKQTLLVKKFREQNRRDTKKINLQNKVINHLMEIFNLTNEDVAVLKTHILKAEENAT